MIGAVIGMKSRKDSSRSLFRLRSGAQGGSKRSLTASHFWPARSPVSSTARICVSMAASSLLVHANHADAKYAGGFIAARGLKPNRHFLLTLHQVSGDRVLDVEESFGRAAGTMPLDLLFADARAVHLDLERTVRPLFSVISRDQFHRMGRVNRQIEREPLSGATAGPARDAHRVRLFALLIEIAFEVNFARLYVCDCRRFQLTLALPLGEQFGGFLFPLGRREQVEIH